MESNRFLVRLDNASYMYPSSFNGPALRPTTVEIKLGEAVRITGRNGTGKTTLLKVLAGVLTPTTGSRNANAELRSVYLDQKAADFLAESLTVREQLFVGLGSKFGPLVSVGQTALNDLLDDLSAYKVELHEKLDVFVAELSGGQRQIIALLSALSTDSELVLLDEFKAAMDPTSAAISDQILQRAIETKRFSAVFVDHLFNSQVRLTQEINLG